jgi:hypothetical protein
MTPPEVQAAAYLRTIEIFTAPAAFAGATHSGVWNVTAVARAAPCWKTSPAFVRANHPGLSAPDAPSV